MSSADHKSRLHEQMMTSTQEPSFQAVIDETLKELLETKSHSPYVYLQKKNSLKAKLESGKSSQYLLQLGIFIWAADPLRLSQEQIQNKVMAICIEKFNHLKVKKNEASQFLNFCLLGLQERDKETYLQRVGEFIENEAINVMLFSQVLYLTLVYAACIAELNDLTSRLKQCSEALSQELLADYLDCASEETSMIKRLGLNFGQHTSFDQTVIEFVVSKLAK